jgi:hypothetical protein
MIHGHDIIRESMERRLLERYVSTADDETRSAFVGTHGRADWQSIVASIVLGLWPRIKAIPVLGPAVYQVFTWLRKKGG